MPASVYSAADLVMDEQNVARAEVLEIISSEVKNIPGTDTPAKYQKIRVRILEGEERGKEILVENDYLDMSEGEIFYLLHTRSSLDGRDYYTVSEPYRMRAVYLFVGLFVLSVFIFGGRQGVRGLGALIISLFFIGYVLLPGIINGHSPVLVSIGVSSLIIILGSYLTHGVNKTTTSAVLGMIITIILTGALAFIAIKVSRLTGFAGEEAMYLNFDTRGRIDFAGLLLGGILIGLLGILYDAAIGQAVAVDELSSVAPHLPRKNIYKRATRIGREHIGALVDTLAIAYVGASLPLLLLYFSSDAGLLMTLNREIFATEIIRTAIGSIGIILAIPITTLVSIFILVPKLGRVEESTIKIEEKKLDEVRHKH